METKLCVKCGTTKDVSLFFYDGRTNKPVSPCKECVSKRSKERYVYKEYPDIINFLGEIWLAIIDYESLYHVSNFGRVKSLNFNHSGKEGLLKHNVDKDGYYTMGLFKNGKQTTFKLHRLVAIAFIQNPLNLPEVNHKWGIKSDNRVSELEWCTTADNIRESLRLGLKVMPKGEKSATAKLTEGQVLEIRELHKENRKGYSSTALKYNVSPSLVSAILNRIIWKHI